MCQAAAAGLRPAPTSWSATVSYTRWAGLKSRASWVRWDACIPAFTSFRRSLQAAVSACLPARLPGPEVVLLEGCCCCSLLVFIIWGFWWAYNVAAAHLWRRSGQRGYRARSFYPLAVPGLWYLEPALKLLLPVIGVSMELFLDHHMSYRWVGGGAALERNLGAGAWAHSPGRSNGRQQRRFLRHHRSCDTALTACFA